MHEGDRTDAPRPRSIPSAGSVECFILGLGRRNRMSRCSTGLESRISSAVLLRHPRCQGNRIRRMALPSRGIRAGARANDEFYSADDGHGTRPDTNSERRNPRRNLDGDADRVQHGVQAHAVDRTQAAYRRSRNDDRHGYRNSRKARSVHRGKSSSVRGKRRRDRSRSILYFKR